MGDTYTNGFGDYSPIRNGNGMHHNPYDTNGHGASPTPDRRPGGYGGLGSARQRGSIPPSQSSGRLADSSRSRRDERGSERTWNSSRSRSRRGDGRAAKQIEDVLWSVKQEWNFMAEDQCIPVQVALQLLDESSLGMAGRYDEFQDAQEQLQTALRGIVNEHHQGFNSSIGTFHQIQASIQSSHDRVRALKARLIDAKTNLTTTKSEFQTLVTTSRSFDGMLEMLNTIEQIKQIPEQLEARISEKQFLGAVDCLQEGLRLMSAPEMDNIGALNEVKVYLSNQELSLADILTEELHNHLYLKSPYCEARWTAYAKLHHRDAQADTLASSSRPLYRFLEEIDTSIPLVEDSYRNPEADSFHYIYIIVEALNRLGRLEAGVEAVEQRLPVELFKVVERTNLEVQQRHPKAIRPALGGLVGVGTHFQDRHASQEILDDLLATMYGRFEAIAESHRAFHDVITGVSRREGVYDKPRLTRSFRELWKLYQSEIRSILHDYLSTDGSGAQRSGPGSAGEGNMFKKQRDRNKKCTFSMDLIDPETPEVKQERDEVIALWQKYVPGLVSLPKAHNTASPSSGGGQNDSSGTGHRLLVEPSVFNISALLPPSVFFLKRLRELVPSGADIVLSTLTSFLNDFLINVFHPQLEETLTEYCSRSYLEHDAFHEDIQWAQHAQKPIFKGSIAFYETIAAFCKLLDELTHDQLFSQLIVEQMHTYYDRCYGWYKALVARSQLKADGRKSKAAAAFAEDGKVCAATAKLWEGDRNDQALIEEEARVLIDEMEKRPLLESDLISDRRTQGALCLLYTSAKWMAVKLADLRHISDRASDSAHMDDPEDKPRLRRSLTASLMPQQDADAPPYLPLSEGTASLFDGIVDGFRELAESVLRTLRLEIRCEVMQNLGSSFHGTLIYSVVTDVADENVLKLIRVVLEFNQEVATYLQPDEYKFLTSGFGFFVDSVLVHTVKQNVGALNANGTTHLQFNTRVLYHNILNVEPTADLPRSAAYLRLFRHGPDAIVAAAAGGSAGVPPGTFSSEELKALLKLRYSEAQESHDREDAMRATESLRTKLQQLDEIANRGTTG